MKQMMTIALAVSLIAGCGSKDEDKGGKGTTGAKGGDKGKGGDTAKLPALTAEPAVEAITPSEKAPFESVKFRMTDQRNDKGWPKYEAWNLGTKPIKFMAITAYAYDKDGKQVARTDVPLSWNGDIQPGAKSDWEIEVGGFGDPIPATSASYELCFDSIKFDGDADFTNQDGACPKEKAKSK